MVGEFSNKFVGHIIVSVFMCGGPVFELVVGAAALL